MKDKQAFIRGKAQQNLTHPQGQKVLRSRHTKNKSCPPCGGRVQRLWGGFLRWCGHGRHQSIASRCRQPLHRTGGRHAAGGSPSSV